MNNRRPRAAWINILFIILLAGCAMAEGPVAQQPTSESSERPAALLLEEPNDPQPVNLPEDATPHNRLTEWWYYTGHLEDANGDLYGFQFVIFQALRGDFPPIYAAHFAITDPQTSEFHYAERTETFAYVAGEYPVELEVGGWHLRGGDGRDTLFANMDDYSLEIELEATKPPVLHEGVGFFEFAPGAASYYYSRTRLHAEGTLTINGEPRNVTGAAWFDQQWGDFLFLDNFGWDWFSVQLDNDEELMAWQSHDRAGSTLDGNATIVREDGTVIDIPWDDLEIRTTGQWQSPRTGGIYPSGWQIEIPEHDISLTVEPIMEDQEMNTTESTGVIYWEGMVTISGTWEGTRTDGHGYVELTGYAVPSDHSTP